MHLSWIDYAIVLVYVGGTIIAGTLARGAIKGISDFLVAGRGLKTHMAVATMVSTGLGLVTVMYMAEEGFKYGFVPFVFGIMALITALIIGRTGFIVSRLRHLQVMTVPEFYEMKYTRGVRLLGGIILTLAGTLNMGLFPILGSKFVVGFTGLDKEYVNYVIVVMLIIVVLSALRGMKEGALVYADQFRYYSVLLPKKAPGIPKEIRLQIENHPTVDRVVDARNCFFRPAPSLPVSPSPFERFVRKICDT